MMMSSLRKGDKLVSLKHPESYLEVLDPALRAGMLEVFDASTKTSRYIEDAVVRASISEGRLVLRRKGAPKVSLTTQIDDPKLQENISFLQNALRRVKKIQTQLGISFNAAIPFAHEEYLKEHANQVCSKPFPSRATLHRASRQQLKGLPILKGNKNKGNTGLKHSQELIQLAKDIIEQHYLRPLSLWTIHDVVSNINRQHQANLKEKNKHQDPSLEPLSNSNRISSKFIKKMIATLTPDAEYERMDPKLRVAGKSIATKRIVAPYPFSRIEQDAVHLPFAIQTPHGISTEIYLEHAIDVCTAYPMGWVLSIGPPTGAETLQCIEMYLTSSKASRFKALGIQNELNIYGTPSQIIFDNGPENKGARIQNLELLGIDIKHCKAKEAQGKPFIERFNKSLKEALQRLPGSTRFDGKDGQRDPLALGDELLSLEELERWIVRWFYEVWVHTNLERLCWDSILQSDVQGITPHERMHYVTQELGYPIPMPPSQHEWYQVRYQHAYSKLSAKTGISVKGEQYKGENIAYLLGKYGDGARLHVVFDLEDFRKIHVYESDEHPLVPLIHEYVRADTPAWSFAQAKEKFKSAKKSYVEPDAKTRFQSDFDQTVMAPKHKKNSKRQTNKKTSRNAKEFSAVVRAAQDPVQPLTPYVPTPLALPANVLSYDDVPDMPIVNRNTGEKLL